MNRRLFVALVPPEPVRRRLAALQAEMRAAAHHAADEVRWVAPENLHLTLQFLGAVPDGRVVALEGAVRAAAVDAATGPLRLELRGAGGFPNGRRPRVIWAGIGGDVAPLGRLVAALERHLSPLGLGAEGRDFSAHVTLGRARDGRGAPGLGAAIAGAAELDGPAWRAGEVCLVESVLSPTGPRYELLDRAPLGASPA
jgi:2'-5' RNA ligase